MELVSHKYLWVIIFMIFAPTVCHRHTIMLCMAGKGDNIDSVVTCYRLDSPILTPFCGGGKIFSLSPTCLDWPWGPPSHVYSGKWPTFLGVRQSGHGAVHLSQTSADINNKYCFISAPSLCYCWHVME